MPYSPLPIAWHTLSMKVMSPASSECSAAQEECIGGVQSLALPGNFAGNVQEVT